MPEAAQRKKVGEGVEDRKGKGFKLNPTCDKIRKMKLKEKTNDSITFITEVEDSLVNAVRRYFNEISVVAINEIEIFKNDSALYDETIAHRIGLIPIKTDKNVSDKEVLKFKLSVSKEGTIYSKDLKGKIELVYDSIPITILNKDQELEIAVFPL